MTRADGTGGGTAQGSTLLLGDDGSLTLPDDAYISSAEVTDNAIVYRFNNLTNTGFANETTIANSIGWWGAGTQGGSINGNGMYPAGNGTKDNGSTTTAWDNFWVDDINLQRTTATEGIIHGQGVTGDDELHLKITNTSGQYDRWGFLFAPNPGVAASVTGAEITSTGMVIPSGGYIKNQSTGGATAAYSVGNTTNYGLTFNGVPQLWYAGNSMLDLEPDGVDVPLGLQFSGITASAIDLTITTFSKTIYLLSGSGTELTLDATPATGQTVVAIRTDGNTIGILGNGKNLLGACWIQTAGAVSVEQNTDEDITLVEQGAAVVLVYNGTAWNFIALNIGIADNDA